MIKNTQKLDHQASLFIIIKKRIANRMGQKQEVLLAKK